MFMHGSPLPWDGRLMIISQAAGEDHHMKNGVLVKHVLYYLLSGSLSGWTLINSYQEKVQICIYTGLPVLWEMILFFTDLFNTDYLHHFQDEKTPPLPVLPLLGIPWNLLSGWQQTCRLWDFMFNLSLLHTHTHTATLLIIAATTSHQVYFELSLPCSTYAFITFTFMEKYCDFNI